MPQMDRTTSDRRSLAQTIGLIFGITYLLVGLLGFTVTGDAEFAGNEGGKLFGLFEVNPLHNIVHLAIGAALTWGALKGPDTARAINTVVGASYLLVGVLGLFVSGDGDANILALNQADNLLHFASAAVLLASAFLGTNHTTHHDTGASTDSRSTSGTRY